MNLCIPTRVILRHRIWHKIQFIRSTEIHQPGTKTHICRNRSQKPVRPGWHFKNELTMAVQCDRLNSTWPSASQHHTPSVQHVESARNLQHWRQRANNTGQTHTTDLVSHTRESCDLSNGGINGRASRESVYANLNYVFVRLIREGEAGQIRKSNAWDHKNCYIV